jgi:membrane protease YdiL (CAAX protease family)
MTDRTAPTKPAATKPAAAAQAWPWGPVAGILIVLAIFFGAQIIGQIIVSIYPALQGWSEGRATDWLTSNAAVQFLYILAVEALTMWMLYMVLRSRKQHFRDLGLLRPRLRDLGTTLAAYPVYFILNAVATLGAAALFHLDTEQRQQTGFETATSTTDLALTFVSLVILPPIVEEIVMRGFLFTSLKKGMPVIRAAIVTSIIFAIAHLQFGSGAPLLWLAAIDTFVLSLVLCYLRQRTGSLWAGIGLHALKNGLAFFVLFIAPRLGWQI